MMRDSSRGSNGSSNASELTAWGKNLCSSLTLLALVTFFLFITGAPTVAQTPANFFEPTIAKKFPPGRRTPCAGCVQEQTALNKAWGDLNDFDKKTNGDFRGWYSAVMKLYDAEKAKDANAIKTAENSIKAESDKLNKKPAYQYQGAEGIIHKTGELVSELTKILGEIEDAAAALEKCEKNPANCPKPAAGPGQGGGAIIPGGGGAVTPGGKKLPPIPACQDENFLGELENMLQQIRLKLGVGGHGLEGQLEDMDKSDPQYVNLKKQVDELKAERAAIERHKAAAEEKWKKNKDKCDPPKKSTMIFPGTPLRPSNQTYAVTFAGDSTTVCTFDDGTTVPAPVAFADDGGNPLDPDALRNAEIVPPKAPETPPTQIAELPPKTPETPPTQTTEQPPRSAASEEV